MFRFFDKGVRRKGVVTGSYPEVPFVPDGGGQGDPMVTDACDLSGACAKACPTGAIAISGVSVKVDLGLCIYCGECARACPRGAIRMSSHFESSSKDRKGLEVEFHVERD